MALDVAKINAISLLVQVLPSLIVGAESLITHNSHPEDDIGPLKEQLVMESAGALSNVLAEANIIKEDSAKEFNILLPAVGGLVKSFVGLFNSFGIFKK